MILMVNINVWFWRSDDKEYDENSWSSENVFPSTIPTTNSLDCEKRTLVRQFKFADHILTEHGPNTAYWEQWKTLWNTLIFLLLRIHHLQLIYNVKEQEGNVKALNF